MTHHYDNCTRVTLVTKGQYVGGLRVCVFFVEFRPRNSYFAARRNYKISRQTARSPCGLWVAL